MQLIFVFTETAKKMQRSLSYVFFNGFLLMF